ncbi:MAG: prepilin-type N-terminal cleavage/methylation domain-containing protein [Bryobacterales bacterium]
MRNAGRLRADVGVTLIELLIVMGIVALVAGIAYPNVSAGLDGIRLKTTANRAGSFWSAARQRADRYQQVVQVVVDPKQLELRATSVDGQWRDSLPIDQHLHIQMPHERAVYFLYPGAPSPKFELLLGASAMTFAGVRKCAQASQRSGLAWRRRSAERARFVITALTPASPSSKSRCTAIMATAIVGQRS